MESHATYFFTGGGTVEIGDFLRGDDLIDQAFFRLDASATDTDDDIGIQPTFKDYDTNHDGVLNAQDKGISVSNGEMAINENVALRNAAAEAGHTVSIGHDMILKLAGITELDSHDFRTY